ncbi:YbbC/YhhH family protein [Dysgonomonas massiliensis]|uniref:YbbC/YhhH family protein n=1 Tax=Dysgonomonas massiliensis TaxID=2040292 RepID=UPI000C761BB0|nr:YbbC/YhhH family protein [Dysgonomonas massiliensis]
MKNIIKIILLIVLFTSCKSYNSSHYPPNGFVPNESTAEKIAEAVWLPIFGKDIYMQKPYRVKLEKGVWIVEGTLESNPGKIVVGGTAYIEINQKDARIMKVSHGL